MKLPLRSRRSKCLYKVVAHLSTRQLHRLLALRIPCTARSMVQIPIPMKRLQAEVQRVLNHPWHRTAARSGVGPEESGLDREAIVKAINDAGLLTYDVRRVRINDYLKSLFSLTRLLTQSGLQPSASYDVVNEIVEMIRSFIKKTKDEGKYDELAAQVLQFKLKTQAFYVFGESVDNHAEMDLFSTTDTDLDRQFHLAELKLGSEGVGIRYGTRYADDGNPAEYKIDVIIFAADSDCMDMLHNYARSRFHDINDANRRRITGLTERYRKKYDSIVSDGDIVSKHNFRLPETISIERSNVGVAYTDHLFVDNTTGKAVINLNNWEKAVLQAERGRSDYICWLRNPPRK